MLTRLALVVLFAFGCSASSEGLQTDGGVSAIRGPVGGAGGGIDVQVASDARQPIQDTLQAQPDTVAPPADAVPTADTYVPCKLMPSDNIVAHWRVDRSAEVEIVNCTQWDATFPAKPQSEQVFGRDGMVVTVTQQVPSGSPACPGAKVQAGKSCFYKAGYDFRCASDAGGCTLEAPRWVASFFLEPSSGQVTLQFEP